MNFFVVQTEMISVQKEVGVELQSNMIYLGTVKKSIRSILIGQLLAMKIFSNPFWLYSNVWLEKDGL